MTVVAGRERSFLDGVRAVATTVAAAAADEVDREARFPHETIGALRGLGALSAYVPVSHGGQGLALDEVGAACFELARACSAAGMVYAMHQIQVAAIVHHGFGTPFFDDYLADLSARQRLIASATSEVGVGGDLRASVAAVTPGEGGFVFEKQAPTVSYGAHADDLLTTLRRSPDAEPGDQVLVLTRGDETLLEPAGSWDSLGMRGTCSPGYVVRGSITADHVLPVPFAEIAAQTMVPVTHILWGHVWLGIATAAYDSARAFVRAQARRTPGAVPPGATRLSALAADLQLLRAEVTAATREYTEMLEPARDRDEAFTLGYAIRINAVKINASERVGQICRDALSICGIAGYRNDTPFSVGRQLRDALSAPLMIANDRIHAANAALLLVHKAG